MRLQKSDIRIASCLYQSAIPINKMDHHNNCGINISYQFSLKNFFTQTITSKTTYPSLVNNVNNADQFTLVGSI